MLLLIPLCLFAYAGVHLYLAETASEIVLRFLQALGALGMGFLLLIHVANSLPMPV